ncbi:MAG: glucosamine-6-phosphate deaminase [Treponema sp.]|jgi:glucosamine-6-phosphate deaminase|nr:glucosamine-6-phosphate deaminase [Treponema sp.]
MRLVIQNDYDAVSRWTAAYIAERINAFCATSDKPFVLGLPTGSSPLGVYKALIGLYTAGKLSFSQVLTFNMDEYVGLDEASPQSYHRFMWDNFFQHIDIDKKNVHILNGMAQDLIAECEGYEQRIASCGGIELFLGGMGEDGHIAFNEPGSSLRSRTRVKTLNRDTRLVNSRFFGNDPGKVPATALTVGVGTIMDSREILIIASGRNKARALHTAIEEGISHLCPLSCLQMHPKAIILCDEDATSELKVSTMRYFKELEGNDIS